MKRLFELALLSAVSVGCAAPQTPGCSITNVLAVGPSSATADHAAAPPGNQVQFQASLHPTPSAPNCPVPQYIALVQPTWTLSDPLDAQINSAGLATCVNAAANPITVTATYTSNGATQTATATLTCK